MRESCTLRQRVAVAACVAVLAGLVLAAFTGPIHDAAREGDLATVKALVSENPKLVPVQPGGV
jgi:hypothetical protein